MTFRCLKYAKPTKSNWDFPDVYVLVPGDNLVIECVIPHLMTVNYATNRCQFSIVAVHSLDSHLEKSWMADNGVLWLHDLLPEKIPHARILTYSYDAYT